MGALEGTHSGSMYALADGGVTENSVTVRVAGLGLPSSSYDSFCIYYQVNSESWNGWDWVYAPSNGSSYTSGYATIYGLPSGSAIYLVAGAKFRGQWYYSSTGYVFTKEWKPASPTVYMEAPRGDTSSITVIARATGTNIQKLEGWVSSPNSTSSWAKITRYPQNSSSTENITFKFENDAYGSKFVAGNTYYFQVTATDSYGSTGYSWEASFTPKNSRPDNFSWNVSWHSGNTFDLRASQWNKFTQTINSFRVYKQYSSINFPQAFSGGSFYASTYNQARDAIASVTGYGNLPYAVSVGTPITPYHLDQMANTLNSIQ